MTYFVLSTPLQNRHQNLATKVFSIKKESFIISVCKIRSQPRVTALFKVNFELQVKGSTKEIKTIKTIKTDCFASRFCPS